VATQIETIQLNERVNTDTLSGYDLHRFQTHHSTVTPSDKHHSLAATLDSRSNPACQNLWIIELLGWIEIDGIVAARTELFRQLRDLAPIPEITIGSDKNDQRIRVVTTGKLFSTRRAHSR